MFSLQSYPVIDKGFNGSCRGQLSPWPKQVAKNVSVHKSVCPKQRKWHLTKAWVGVLDTKAWVGMRDTKAWVGLLEKGGLY